MGPGTGGRRALGDLSGVAELWLKILLLRAYRDFFSEADNAALSIDLLIACPDRALGLGLTGPEVAEGPAPWALVGLDTAMK
jgi:hypothetical protein